MSSALDLLQLRIHRDQVGELLGGDPSSGLPSDITRPDGGEHRLGLQGGKVLLALPRDQLGEQSLEPVDDLDPMVRQFVAAVGQHPQRLELTVGPEDS